jgi:hypothetical protein
MYAILHLAVSTGRASNSVWSDGQIVENCHSERVNEMTGLTAQRQ